jgi:hypothetical protein
MPEKPDVENTVRQIEQVLDDLAGTDPDSRAKAERIIGLLMELYGAGLGRAVEILRDTNGAAGLGRMADDKLVASLLLLHGLHPENAETRVGAALHRLERGLDSHHLALSGIVDGVAQIRVERNGGGPAPSGLAEAIERAVAECAPDLAGVEIEGAARDGAELVQIELAPGR